MTPPMRWCTAICTCCLESSCLFPFTVTLVDPPNTESVIGGTIWASPAPNESWEETEALMPGAVTVIVYTSGGSSVNKNCPLLPDSTVRKAEPADPASDTRAPCTTSRFVSTTVPVMLPATDCSEILASLFCCGWGASGSALSLAAEPKFCCPRTIEGTKVERGKPKMAVSNGFDHRATFNTEHYPRLKNFDPIIVRCEISLSSYPKTWNFDKRRSTKVQFTLLSWYPRRSRSHLSEVQATFSTRNPAIFKLFSGKHSGKQTVGLLRRRHLRVFALLAPVSSGAHQRAATQRRRTPTTNTLSRVRVAALEGVVAEPVLSILE